MTAERDALAELVAAQDADEMGDPEAWVARWYVAWAAARAALAAPPAVSVPREATEAMYDAAPDPTAAQPDDVERWGNADTDETGRKSGWHQRADGYWTPWHIADAALRRERERADTLQSQYEHIMARYADMVRIESDHCKDCCCARSWTALGISGYTGKSIPEEIEAIRADRDRLAAEREKLRAIVKAADAMFAAGGVSDEDCAYEAARAGEGK